MAKTSKSNQAQNAYPQLAQQYAQLSASYYPSWSNGWYIVGGEQQGPQEPPGKTVVCVGRYKLKYAANYFSLYHGLDTFVCSWNGKSMPSRSILAHAIRFHRSCRPRVNARDPVDGSLMGVRYFILTDDYHLQSPQQKTVWEKATLTVPQWSDDSAVRGEMGVHACWPAWNGVMQPHIDMECPNGVMAQVRGYGKYVSGKEGWRAEKVIVDTVYLPPELVNRWRVVKRLSRLYPEITFEAEPWTLERSSRLAK